MARSEYEQAAKEAEDQITDGQVKIIDGEKAACGCKAEDRRRKG